MWRRRKDETKHDAKDERQEWLEAAGRIAIDLTETATRCHLNQGKPRFCIWVPRELTGQDSSGAPAPMVAVRCSAHEGGRLLEAGTGSSVSRLTS